MKVKASSAMRGLTLRIELVGMRRMKLRLHAATLLMKAAGAIAGCDVAVDLVPTAPAGHPTEPRPSDRR